MNISVLITYYLAMALLILAVYICMYIYIYVFLTIIVCLQQLLGAGSGGKIKHLCVQNHHKQHPIQLR